LANNSVAAAQISTLFLSSLANPFTSVFEKTSETRAITVATAIKAYLTGCRDSNKKFIRSFALVVYKVTKKGSIY
jgi:hypothetical protein